MDKTIKNSKRYLIINKDDLSIDYVLIHEIIDKINTYSLIISNGSQWSDDYKNTIALVMVDDLEGFKFDRNLKALKYHEFEYLRILLEFEKIVDRESTGDYQFIEEKPIN